MIKSRILLVIIGLMSFGLAFSSLWLNRTANNGWDFKIYEKAVSDYNSGINPYVNNDLPFVYPPLALKIFQITNIICNHDNYIYFWILFLMFMGYLIYEKNCDLFLLSVLMATGYMGLHYNLLTGNIEILSALFLCLSIIFVKKKSFVLSLSLASFVKILPVSFFGWILFSNYTLKQKIINILYFVLFMLILFIIPYLIWTELSMQYIQNVWLAKRSSVQTASGTDGSILGIFSYLNDNKMFIMIMYGLWISIIMSLFWLYRKNTKDDVELYCYWILAAFLCWPRLMVYSYILIIIPTYILIKNMNNYCKTCIIGLACLLPYASIAIRFINNKIFSTNYPINGFFVGNTLLISLFLVYIMILVFKIKERENYE